MSIEVHTERILVIDDHDQMRTTIGHVLMRASYSCQLASDAPDARDMLNQGSYDLVLCDISLPGGSGLALAKEIATQHPDSAVVMITALEGEDIAGTAAEFGASAHITKPFTQSQLLTTVTSVLRRRSLEQEHRRNPPDDPKR
jgi:DNA-binding NtrC family response regulator